MFTHVDWEKSNIRPMYPIFQIKLLLIRRTHINYRSIVSIILSWQFPRSSYTQPYWIIIKLDNATFDMLHFNKINKHQFDLDVCVIFWEFLVFIAIYYANNSLRNETDWRFWRDLHADLECILNKQSHDKRTNEWINREGGNFNWLIDGLHTTM